MSQKERNKKLITRHTNPELIGEITLAKRVEILEQQVEELIRLSHGYCGP